MYIACENPNVLALGHDVGRTQTLAALMMDAVLVNGKYGHGPFVHRVLGDLRNGCCVWDIDESLSDLHADGKTWAPRVWRVVLEGFAKWGASLHGPMLPPDYWRSSGGCRPEPSI